MMGRHKKVMCKVCYREMRSDVRDTHMKQHLKKNESNPVVLTSNKKKKYPQDSDKDSDSDY